MKRTKIGFAYSGTCSKGQRIKSLCQVCFLSHLMAGDMDINLGHKKEIDTSSSVFAEMWVIPGMTLCEISNYSARLNHEC